MSFTAQIWPEHAVPKEWLDCQKCELANQRKRVIWGEGNPSANLVIILDNPGARENREGEPFVCGTRETLQQAAYEVGLGMDDMYITYILKCRPIRKYDKELARSACLSHLHEQLTTLKPKIVFCLGNIALQAYTGNAEAEVKNWRGTWHQFNGIETAAAYHPLAVRRRPVLYRFFIEDWKKVAGRLSSL